MDEYQLILKCKKGDRNAQKALFEAFSKGMLLLCRRYVRDFHEAEDVLMRGFQKFFSTIGRFENTGEKSIGAWLKQIMINECLLLLRSKGNIVYENEDVAADIYMDDDVLQKISAYEILQAINRLPDGYRVVFNMYVLEGYNNREIANLLDITEGTSKSQLSKSKVYLQKLLLNKLIWYEQ